MELKRILARDSRAANEKAIQLYGKDVLIISSQRLDNQTELIVAVDIDVTNEAPALPAETAQESIPARDEVFVPFSKLFQSASAFAPLESDEPSMPAALSVGAVAGPVALTSAADTLGQANAPELATPADAQQVHHESQRSHEIVEMLRLEMAALRKEFSLSRQMMPWQDGLRLSPAIMQLSMAMNEVGIPAGLRALLTDSIQDFVNVNQALPVMHNLLVNALSRPVMAVPVAGVHALCGPSGSGKTSMVGRLAYMAAQVHGVESQVMVSFADQRPGAWAQMQLLAAQSGVTCFRATHSDMLRTLLQELEGKTVWIDSSGTDFAAQAELLMTQHPNVMRHAVLPLDATVTSVQKILQNSTLNWSSLMLTKVDEAAYPWALIKGLSEQALGVSCMAGSNRIDQPAESFDAVRLVHLAMAPLLKHMPEGAVVDQQTTPSAATARKTRLATPKPKRVSPEENEATKRSLVSTKISKIKVLDVIEIPTLKANLEPTVGRKKSSNGSVGKKILNG
jgi:flagellar biosynthesis protein FlhF